MMRAAAHKRSGRAAYLGNAEAGPDVLMDVPHLWHNLPLDRFTDEQLPHGHCADSDPAT